MTNDHMIAIAVSEPGPPEVLVPVERPTPQPGPDELLIKVAAAGVNRPDVMQRQGRYAPPQGVTDIPGLEVAGTVAAMGSAVTGWSVGDRVCALVAGGGYAGPARLRRRSACRCRPDSTSRMPPRCPK